jgi:hypothetical protein
MMVSSLVHAARATAGQSIGSKFFKMTSWASFHGVLRSPLIHSHRAKV